MRGRLALILALTAVSAASPAFASPASSRTSRLALSTCGNGSLDAGEQCDATVPGSGGDCCDPVTCRFLPSATPCAGGLGVCGRAGGSDDNAVEVSCLQRADTCSRYDQIALQIGQQSVRGPFAVCAPTADAGAPAVAALLASGAVADTSVLSQLLDAPYLEQVACTTFCRGTVDVNTATCIDFAAFPALSNDTTVPDGLGCGVDRTTSVALATIVDGKEELGALFAPGVCKSGTCVVDSCRADRCSNNGACVFAPAIQASMSRALGVSINETAVTPTTESDALVQCQCDSGWTGSSCALADGRMIVDRLSSS